MPITLHTYKEIFINILENPPPPNYKLIIKINQNN